MAIKPTIAAVATTICMATAIAGCSGGAAEKEPRQPSSQVGDAASGPKIDADNYSYNAPDGWGEPAQQPPGFSFDSVAAEKDPGKDGFADNVNVLHIESSPVDSVDDLEDQAIKELETVGIADLEVKDRVSVDGSDAIHLAGGASMNKIEYVVEQFSIMHEGSLYFVTFSFTPNTKVTDREEVADSVLATWKWKN